MSYSVNFYEVLGVETNASIKDIKKQYSKLVVKYHPDKSSTDDTSSLFQLIQRAYDTLGNEQKRKDYDFYLKNISIAKNNDHFGLKNNHEKYTELSTPKISKEDAKIEFDKVFSELDFKHGINRSDLNEIIDKDKLELKLDDLLLQREQEELEYSQNKLFDEGIDFDISKFNSAFDYYKNSTDKQLTKHNKISPFNFDNNYSDLNSYDKIYTDEFIDGNNFNFGKTNKLDKDKIKNLPTVDYTLGHNKLDLDYNNDLQRRIKERELESHQLNNLNYGEFNNEDRTFQFSHEVGITEDLLDWENSDDLLDACKKLIELEKRSK